jgi:uncharacterized membrane protein
MSSDHNTHVYVGGIALMLEYLIAICFFLVSFYRLIHYNKVKSYPDYFRYLILTSLTGITRVMLIAAYLTQYNLILFLILIYTGTLIEFSSFSCIGCLW